MERKVAGSRGKDREESGQMISRNGRESEGMVYHLCKGLAGQGEKWRNIIENVT